MQMKSYKIGIDLGGTLIKAALFDSDMKLLNKVRVETASRSFSSVCLQLEEVHRKLSDLSPGPVSFTGIGVPGGVLNDGETIHVSPNFPGWRNVNLAEALRSRGLPRVLLANDANCAALAESVSGGGRGYSSSILFTLGTGVGGGMMIEGRMYRGEWGMAGELGHIPVFPDGYPCTCGSKGCLETYASGTAILARACEAWEAGRIPAWDHAPLSPYAVFQEALNGQEDCQAIFQQAGRALGIAISGLINTLNVPIFLIGGGVGATFELLLPPIKTEIAMRSFAMPAREVRIQRAMLGNDAGMTGAALLDTI